MQLSKTQQEELQNRVISKLNKTLMDYKDGPDTEEQCLTVGQLIKITSVLISNIDLKTHPLTTA